MVEDASVEISRRMERYSGWPWSYSILVLVGFAYFFGLYDVLTIGVAGPTIGAQFGIPGPVVSSTGTIVSLIGYPIGAFVLSHISDSLGRKKALSISLITYSVGSLLTAVSTNILEIYAWRVLTGIGIGADLAIASAYLSELSSSKSRGRFQSLGTFFGFTGAGIAPIIGYFLIPALSYGWRLYFIVGAVGAVFVLFYRKDLPESPRWYLMKGRIDDARKVVDRLESHQMKKNGSLPPLGEIEGGITTSDRKIPLLNLFSRKHGMRLIIVLIVFLFYYVYAYPFLGLTTSLLAASGYTIATSLLVVGLGGLGFALGAFLSFIFADQMERKYLIAVLFFVQGLSMWLIGIKTSVAEVVIADFIASFSNTFLATMLYVYAAENFPTSARSNGVAATDGLGHIAPIFMVGIAFSIFIHHGFYITYLTLAVLAVVGGIIVLPGIRSTTRKLEDISG